MAGELPEGEDLDTRGALLLIALAPVCYHRTNSIVRERRERVLQGHRLILRGFCSFRLIVSIAQVVCTRRRTMKQMGRAGTIWRLVTVDGAVQRIALCTSYYPF